MPFEHRQHVDLAREDSVDDPVRADDDLAHVIAFDLRNSTT